MAEISDSVALIAVLFFILVPSMIVYLIQKRNISKLKQKLEGGDPELTSHVQQIDEDFKKISMNLANLPRNEAVKLIEGKIEDIPSSHSY